VSFVHLHTHSEFSLLDGANRIPDLYRRAEELEMPGLALTDHGCLYGAWTFLQQAKRHRTVKPIVGMEAYVSPGDRRDRSPAADGRPYYHLVLLARDAEGYRNLVRLSSIGYLEGFYRRPRVDREVLAAHSGGLIVTSACMAGEVARHLTGGDPAAAREAAQWYANTFDGRYYLEVQAHDTPGQAALNRSVFGLAEELGLPVVATNDAHFLRPEDHDAHDVLLCIGLGKDRSDEARMRYDRGLYFKGPDEIRQRFADRPDVMENTLAIADQVDIVLEKRYHVPSFPLPQGATTEQELLRSMAYARARERYGDPLPDEVRVRLEYELSVITENPDADYSGYFLITQDFINWAKERGIPVGPGRGSAAGSLVAYVLGITDVDPLEFDLLFERFLNPARVSMPDIDVDFCYERRGEVIDYVREKYGRDSVGQIITFGTMKSRAVVRDVGRVLGFEPAETDRLAKLIPNAPNNSMTVEEAAEKVPELRELVREDERVGTLVEYAKTLEGLSRHASVHAAGVVIAPGPLHEYVPVCTQSTRGSGGNGEEEALVTQWDMIALEQAGMLKMDFLGLKTLTVIHDAEAWIRQRHGALRHPETADAYGRVEDIPLDDPGVYQMLARGGTMGVFQFESSLANDKLRAMRCDRFEDLVATNALIRPGPLDSGMTDVFVRRKTGREPVTYPLPQMEEVLAPTYGVMTYQEQVMRIAQVLAGFSLAEADVLRKAVGKKDAALIRRELGKFVERAVENGVPQRQAEEISAQIETFGRYGFNRSHSVAYALLSYRTAWLKRYYPAEFMAAVLTAVVSSTDDVVKYINECRELGRSVPGFPDGIKVLPPSIEESAWAFTPVADDEVRFGLGAIRGLGEGAARSIVEARHAGPFASLFDLCERTDPRACGKRALEALVLSGACDSLGRRAQLMAGLDATIREAALRREEAEVGQASLFDGGGADAPGRPPPRLPEVTEWPEKERLAKEKEILGFFISGHPLERFRDVLGAFSGVHTANLKEYRDRTVELPCVVTGVKRQFSRRNGAEWARLSVEDFHGTATVLAFGEAWEENRSRIRQDEAVLVRGEVSGKERDEDAPPIFLREVVPLLDIREGEALALELDLGADVAGVEQMATAARALRDHRGASPVTLLWRRENGNGGEVQRFRSRSLRVDVTPVLMTELRSLFGDDHVRLVRAEDASRPAR